MGAASSATGTGTIRFAGGTSRVAPGAGYAAGITEIGNGGTLDFDDDGSTGALRMTGDGTRRGDGTLTVGERPVVARAGQFLRRRHDRVQRRLADDDHRHVDFFAAGSHAAAERHHDVVGRHRPDPGRRHCRERGVAAGHRQRRGRDLRRRGPEAAADAGRGRDRGLGLARRSASELENDGTLRRSTGGTLTQSNAVASPADSAGSVRRARDRRAVAEQRADGCRRRARRAPGTIRFAGGTSRVAPGAGYAAGITELGTAACSTSTTTAAPARCAWPATARVAATAR